MKLRNFILTLIVLVFAFPCFAKPQPLATKHMFDHVARGNAKLLNRLPATQVMRLSVLMPSRDQAGLDKFLKDVQDPKSPLFHKYLSVKEFTDRFAPTQADYDAVTNHLVKTHGFKVNKAHINRLVLDVEAPVNKVEKAFNIQMNEYQHPTEKRTFFHPDKEPTVDLSVKLWHITGLNNYSIPKPFVSKRDVKPESKIPMVGDIIQQPFLTGSGPGGFYKGSDMRKAYYSNGGLTGTGQSVAMVEFAPYDIADVKTYFLTTDYSTGTQMLLNLSSNIWSNNSPGYDTFTINSNHRDIDSLINTSGTSESCSSVSIPVTSGKTYLIKVGVTNISGQYPTLTGTNGFVSRTLVSSNYISWTATGTSVTFTLTNTAVGNNSLVFYMYQVGEISIPIVNISADGTSSPTCINPNCDSNKVEVVLDINMAISMAPGLDGVRVYTSNTSDSAIFNSIATDNISKQISISWGWGLDDVTANDTVLEELAAQGQTVFAASGDSGSWNVTNPGLGIDNVIDTTGGTFAVAAVTTYNGFLSGNPQVDSDINGMSDSKANTWHYLTSYGSSANGTLRLYYSFLTNMGSGHHFTYSTQNPETATVSIIVYSGNITSFVSGSDQGRFDWNGTNYGTCTYQAGNNKLCVSAMADTGDPGTSCCFGGCGCPGTSNLTISDSSRMQPNDIYGIPIINGIDMGWGKTTYDNQYVTPAWYDGTGSTILGHIVNLACFSATGTITPIGYGVGNGVNIAPYRYTYPAEHPYITAVGGTSLTTGTEQVWSSETSWTDSGGGISLDNFAIPSYQQTTGIINVNNGGSNTYRNAPDVSAAADFMYYTCYSGTCAGGYGGTSFASPLWAAFNALINQRSLGNNNGYVGFINPALYSIFLGPNYSSAFHDIITGTNAGTANSQCTAVSTPSACCTGLGTGSCTGVVNEWNAVTNYDLVTGGGSFKPGLIDLLGGLDTTPPTLSSATIGTNGTTLTLVLSEAVVNHTGFSVSPSNTLTYVSGSGSTTLVFTLTTTVYSGAMDTLSYSAGDVTDAASNPLATISGASITNNSTQTQGGTPSAPSSITGGIFTGKRQ